MTDFAITLSGKGLANQDRNILANQVLILGFFRSAAKMLQVGQPPCLTGSSKRKSRKDDDDDDGDSGDEGKDQLLATRGTVLITLRNVVPYTLWQVSLLVVDNEVQMVIYQGCSPSSKKPTICYWQSTTKSGVYAFEVVPVPPKYVERI